MESQRKECPHCGSTSTIPIVYGHMPRDTHQENAVKKEWAWGGCKFGAIGTDHCNNCGESFGKVVSYDNGRKKLSINELQSEIIKLDAKLARENIKEDVKNLLLKFKSLIGISNGK